jgi:hypothetical protein
MAIPVRSIPVIEGEVARRFEREARKAEKNRGTIKFSKEDIESYQVLSADFRAQMAKYK